MACESTPRDTASSSATDLKRPPPLNKQPAPILYRAADKIRPTGAQAQLNPLRHHHFPKARANVTQPGEPDSTAPLHPSIPVRKSGAASKPNHLPASGVECTPKRARTVDAPCVQGTGSPGAPVAIAAARHAHTNGATVTDRAVWLVLARRANPASCDVTFY